MSEPVRAEDIGSLSRVIDAIHDRWFDVEDIKLDTKSGTLTVPFQGEGDGERGTLLIHRVESYQVEETEGIGSYDFNELVFDAESSVLTITTGVPLTFQVSVRSLDVAARVDSFSGP